MSLLFITRTQFKKFLGKSVKKAKHLAEEYGEKAVNKVKSVRDEGKRTQLSEVIVLIVRFQENTSCCFFVGKYLYSYCSKLHVSDSEYIVILNSYVHFL